MIVNVGQLFFHHLRMKIKWKLGWRFNLKFIYVVCSASQIYGGDFAKICGILRIYELYISMCQGFQKCALFASFCKVGMSIRYLCIGFILPTTIWNITFAKLRAI